MSEPTETLSDTESEAYREKLFKFLVETPKFYVILDTSIFFREGFALHEGRLRYLSQISDEGNKVLMPDIVVQELKKHLSIKAKENREKLKSAVNDARKFLGLDERHADSFLAHALPQKSDSETASEIADRFMAATKVEVVSAVPEVMSDMLSAYFDAKAPFGNAASKKSEFPDAIALLSVSKGLLKSKMIGIVLSHDKGWRAFADASDQMIFCPDVSSLLEGLSRRDRRYSTVTDRLCDILIKDEFEVLSIIRDAVERQIYNLYFNVEADSVFNYEVEQEDVSLLGLDVANDVPGYQIVQVDRFLSDGAIVEVKLNLKMEVHLEFSFSVHDSVDKDYVNMGDGSASEESQATVRCLLNIQGDTNDPNAQYKIRSVKLLRQRVDVNVGMIEPAWMDEPHEE